MMIKRVGGLKGVYQSVYPPMDDDHVKATTTSTASYLPYFVCDPSNSLIGASANNSWRSYYNSITNQRFHIDLGAKYLISRIYYENFHDSGSESDQGANNVIVQGSNTETAFDNLTYATNTNWTQLTTDISQLVQHVALNQVDPHYIIIYPSVAYRYYALKFADNKGDLHYLGIRRIELQTAL